MRQIGEDLLDGSSKHTVFVELLCKSRARPLETYDQPIAQRPWGVDPGLPWHGATVGDQRWNRKL